MSELDPRQVAADDELLDAFASVTWGPGPEREPQPTPPAPPGSPRAVADLLAALRADIDAGLAPAIVRAEAAATPLGRARSLRRAAVTAGVAAAVLSVSGVAAAGFSGTTGPLAPLHQAIWGPSDSAQAAAAVARFLGLARADLAAGRLRACDEALDHAEQRLPAVDAEDLGSLGADVAALREQLTTAYAAAAAAADKRDAERAAARAAKHAGDDDSATGHDNRGHGSDKDKDVRGDKDGRDERGRGGDERESKDRSGKSDDSRDGQKGSDGSGSQRSGHDGSEDAAETGSGSGEDGSSSGRDKPSDD